MRRMVTILFDYSILTRSEIVCNLGGVFDKKLSFNEDVDATVSIALKSNGSIVPNSRYSQHTQSIILLICQEQTWICLLRVESSLNGAYWWTWDIAQKFLKLLYFRECGVYPEICIPQLDLMKRFMTSSIPDKPNKVAVSFLMNFLRNTIDLE